MNKVAIIGSGFSSLSASCYLAQAGYEVTIYEKNDTVGGRARRLIKDGFIFDIGPSWYWMPDIFERFFADFNKKPSDYYQLDKLNPAYSVVFEDEKIDIADNLDDIKKTFESIEKGSSKPLQQFMSKAEENYEIAIKNLVYRPGESPLELITPQTAQKVGAFIGNVSKDVRKKFTNPKLVSILEFPVLFLGATPQNTPSFYNFMNYADFGLGTWHPKGGMYEVILAMKKLAEELGVVIKTNSPVDNILVDDAGRTEGLTTNGQKHLYPIVLSGADYHHSETLLEKKHRQYSESYWEKKTFAPSSLIFYVGFDKKLKNIDHHNLFFDTDFTKHANEIYEDPKWPEEPLFYANFTSLTDPSTAPEGCENGFFLIPLAPDLEDTPELREEYFDKIITRFEKRTNQEVKSHILFKESFCVNDFISEYNSYKGNAYGMANTLLQTAFLRPNLRSRKVKNLYFTGQLTVPGPGVPPSLISGKLAAELIKKYDQ
ncbi:phytoene desaturase [Nonlabens dokdonensis]|uniref:Phytoene desaturase n=2 Tax=Nonlabens dokdonensis TaxID=328515 RepID=L7WBN7_NONDD|nr:phytoene desaturase family protein [Nonlabens dokdonensis]AGC77524.1 phytoene desaturase [Nonlabens dokdonensis DSW-6]PZX39921.1 phytoene desaturase [Nonlabens dokdonensis]